MIDEFDTPTHKRIGFLLDEFIFGPAGDREHLNLDDSDDLLARITNILAEECGHRVVFRDAARDLFRYGMDEARALAGRDEDTRESVEFMLGNITMGMVCLINEVVCANTQEERTNNVRTSNHAKGEAKKALIPIIQRKIRDDVDQNYRIGRLLDECFNELKGTEHEPILPQSQQSKRRWARELKSDMGLSIPEYMSRPGKK
ncbi:hypothetical protein [Microbulbifer sp.]|uniref:hypothetical protein n=1 Tax=Microbulbifer sp. TaxID=1908541 RepID=UPI003F2E3EC4